MAADESLNHLFYVPSRRDLLANALMFLCALLLAEAFHFLPMDPANLAGLIHDPSSTLLRSLLLVGIAFLVNYLIVFSAVDKYFLNWRQSASASIGTTITLCVAYSSVWGAYHLPPPQWQTVVRLFHTPHWRPFVQALRAGSVLACLSSVPLKVWTNWGNQEFFDYTPLRKATPEWKDLALKIERTKSLAAPDHNRMMTLLKGMTDALAGLGIRQPVTRRSSQRLKTALDIFSTWYTRETKFSPADLQGFGPEIRDTVAEIRALS
jgi:hypothetical protein